MEAITPEMIGRLQTVLEEGNSGYLRYGGVRIYNAENTFRVSVEGEFEEINVYINGEKKKCFDFEEGDYPDAELMETLKFIQKNIQPFVNSKFIVKGMCDSNIFEAKDVTDWARVVLKDTFIKFLVEYCKVPAENISMCMAPR